ncbi:MAG TPA: hypothetical protein VM070_00630 [Candidatus Saccharimonadales bacterium]|nr:hypothetical protein [Candidatus Saccharimonadales bacterium]
MRDPEPLRGPLGDPGAVAPAQLPLALPLGTAVRGAAAFTTLDDGTTLEPRTEDDWDDWVAAGATRAWCRSDQLWDWLDRFGGEKGFARDDQRAGYDEQFDLGRFLRAQGERFEAAVIADLDRRHGVVRIGGERRDPRSLEAAAATWAAMERGAKVIAQGVLRDPQARMYGLADLLIRSDILAGICADAFAEGDDPAFVAPGLRGAAWHYRVVDVKFTTLDLLKDGSLSASGDLAALAQVWAYGQALGRAQGYAPPFGYVLGRGWKQGQQRGDRCWDRLARVPHDGWVKSREITLAEAVAQAAAWVRLVRHEGRAWDALPEPTREELRPNLKADRDQPWHEAKREIAEELHDLTLLWQVSTTHRERARAQGVTRWDDPRVSAELLGITGEARGPVFDAILAANREPGPPLRPPRIGADGGRWRDRRPAEAYVDFETVNDLNDDLSRFPERGGQSLIFQIGCGRLQDGVWTFAQFTARALTAAAEGEMIDAWLEHLGALARAAGLDGPAAVRLFHWSAAETVFMDAQYRSARARHPERDWPLLDWYDLLTRVVRAEPVVVRGSRSFGLKSVARAMHTHGLVATGWGDGLADGTGAMVGAWTADGIARRASGAIADVPLMAEVSRYNEIDCRVMAEVLDHLRREH